MPGAKSVHAMSITNFIEIALRNSKCTEPHLVYDKIKFMMIAIDMYLVFSAIAFNVMNDNTRLPTVYLKFIVKR